METCLHPLHGCMGHNTHGDGHTGGNVPKKAVQGSGAVWLAAWLGSGYTQGNKNHQPIGTVAHLAKWLGEQIGLSLRNTGAA